MCIGVKTRKFLSFILIKQGIEVNLTKCRAIIEMKSTTNVKEVQALNDRLVASTDFHLGQQIPILLFSLHLKITKLLNGLSSAKTLKT